MGIVFIYGLVDPINEKIRYVGKTVNLENRLKQHINRCKFYIRNNKKRLSKKEKWICELLSLGFEPKIVQLKITNELEYEFWEEFYILKLKADGLDLLNYDDKGVGMQKECKYFGKKQSKKLYKKVLMYDLNGVFIIEFKSLRDAEKKTGINHGNISKVCNGKWKHCSGKIFKFKSDVELIKPIENPNAIKKKVIEIDMYGCVIGEWESLMDCSRETFLDNGNLSKVCNGILKSHKKRKFKFK